jgi:HAD superfamily hydrolase (TIGR01490 family)
MMGRKFAVFDIDGTVIRWQLYHAIFNELVRQGSVPARVGNHIHAARMTWKNRKDSNSFKTYELALVESYTAALTDLTVVAYQRAVDSVFDEYKDQVYTYTRDLIADLKADGYLLFALSGSQHEIVNKLADYYGFDAALGLVYEQVDGRFTGKFSGPLHAKGEALKRLVAEHRTDFTRSIAVGDSESDIAMLELVERAIAFNPSQGLLDHAKLQGWEVVVERKNVVYKLEPSDGSYLLA